ncbi:hypothetical protein CWI38_0136p0030 [Hamiltosporidium tvaerminnensis]|uniref:Uncharacterized protein n=1 Tax=Hamiltosporidium tvaerminnensis TaxID=1176355 RepID=A0A4Q9M3I1_9MICR|nr:hypothetical protein CWI38_0136p0030 [Hamiltosporidium tvaerminnensis]
MFLDCKYNINQILNKEYIEIRVDTTIKTDNIPHGSKNKHIPIKFLMVEMGKLRKYNMLNNNLGLINKFSAEIISYGITNNDICEPNAEESWDKAFLREVHKRLKPTLKQVKLEFNLNETLDLERDNKVVKMVIKAF